MDKKYHLETLISEEQLENKIVELGKKIKEDYEGEDLLCIGILKGAASFLSNLIQKIDSNKVAIDFMSVSSYGQGTESSGNIKILKDLDAPIEGKNVLIVEDILDTGNTLYSLRELFKTRKMKSFKICTLLDKPSRRVKQIDADYRGFEIEDLFVVGYGIDYAEYHRNLPYIAKVVFDE